MKDLRKFRNNLIFLFVITILYMVGAYMTRGYYALGLEAFTPAWVFVCWIYADKDQE